MWFLWILYPFFLLLPLISFIGCMCKKQYHDLAKYPITNILHNISYITEIIVVSTFASFCSSMDIAHHPSLTHPPPREFQKVPRGFWCVSYSYFAQVYWVCFVCVLFLVSSHLLGVCYGHSICWWECQNKTLGTKIRNLSIWVVEWT